MRATVIALVMSAAAFAAAGQTPVPREQPLVIKSTVGSELYKFYCSTCHGIDAKGQPAATPARPAAPNLTILAQTNGGIFPRDRVLDVVRHGSEALPGHGPTGMPVWGAIFRGLGSSDTLVDIRLENLVQYLESIQERGSRTGAQR